MNPKKDCPAATKANERYAYLIQASMEDRAMAARQRHDVSLCLEILQYQNREYGVHPDWEQCRLEDIDGCILAHAKGTCDYFLFEQEYWGPRVPMTSKERK